MTFHLPQSSRFAALAAVAVLSVGAAKHAAAADLATTLASNPQFSDFVTQLRIAGVWPMLENTQNVTVFAPTNATVERSQGWQSQLVDTQTNPFVSLSAYQNKLMGDVIRGVHPVGDFAGKAQRVHTLGGATYWVDGRTGVIQVGTQPSAASGEMGMPPVNVQMATLGQPISTDDGMIYPLNAVVR